LPQLTGFSSRQLQRKLSGLQQRFHIAPWRTFVSAWRTISACALLSTPRATTERAARDDGAGRARRRSGPRATTERAARAVGYGSPAALCHAFMRASFPPRALFGPAPWPADF